MIEMAEADLAAPVIARPTAPKAKLTIYVVLLIMALVAMLIGCGFLYAEISGQGGWGQVRGRVSAHQQPAQTLLAAAPRDGLPAVR